MKLTALLLEAAGSLRSPAAIFIEVPQLIRGASGKPQSLTVKKHMVKNPKRLVALTFILAAALSELAAVLPMIRGRPLNAAFFGAGLLFLVVGLVKLKASKGTHDGSAT